MIEYRTHCGMVSKYNFILVKAISRDNRLKAVEKSGYHVTSGVTSPVYWCNKSNILVQSIEI